MKTIVIIMCVIVLAGAGAYGGFNYLLDKATAVPSNSPLQCPRDNQTDSQTINTDPSNVETKNIMVAVGDSITHAKVSADYLELLAKQNENQSFTFINAGINSRLAFNALQEVDKVVACNPSVITILIGTNDVLATSSDKVAQYYIDLWKLPQKPDFAFYQDNLTELIEQLQRKTTAKIAILSLPPVGEKVDSIMNKTVAKYNAFIKETADQYDLAYLPLNERMWQTLNLKGNMDSECPFDEPLTEKAIAKYYLFDQSWNDISADNNLELLTDCIHLNENGAQIIADLIQEFLDE